MLILKGMVIGIGKIIPGVSGSMLAISMGIYQDLINSVNTLFRFSKENIKFLIKICIGILLSIIFFSNIIFKCLNSYYLITIFFFIGLILGSLQDIKSNIVEKNYLLTFLTFMVIIALGLINITPNPNSMSYKQNIIFYIFSGFADAVTMVIPGISGTATLMMLGSYNSLIFAFSNILSISNFIDNFKILFPFFIGVLIGIFITVKIVNYLFKNHKSKTYSVILGFSMSTIVIMAIKCFNSAYSLVELIIGFIFLILGFYITKKINHCF